MLSAATIQRRFESQEYDQLLDALARNGMPLPLPLRVRLSAGPAATLGLALRRLVELTYGPTALSRAMLDALLAIQNADGSFPGNSASDPLATACVLAALNRVQQEQPAAREPAIEHAKNAAIASLSMKQDHDGLFRCGDERTDLDAATTSAFVLYLLGREDDFRQSVRYADLCVWFEEHERQLDRTTRLLWEMAQQSDPTEALWQTTPAAA